MGHVSFELAKKLQEAGLKWEPKNGDIFYLDYMPLRYCQGCFEREMLAYHKNHRVIFTPNLNQLLTEIEKYGYMPSSQYTIAKWWRENKGKYNLSLGILQGLFHADTREDAAAKALLYILQEKAGVINEN